MTSGPSFSATMLLAAAGAAAAQDVRPDPVRPRAAAVYGDDDPGAPLKLRIETLAGVYLVDPPRRHEVERVHLTQGRARIDYWQPLGDNTDVNLITRAVQWFVLGRTQYASGVRGIFSEMPAVDEVSLVFLDVVRVDRKGRRPGDERVVPYLQIRLRRPRFERLDPEVFRRCAERGDCTSAFRSAFDEARFDRRGLKVR